MSGRLQDRVAIVTGAGCIGPGWGNGRATAVRFVEEGAKIFSVDRDLDSMDETVERAKAAGGEIVTHQCDVTDAGSVEAMVKACLDRFGRKFGLYVGAFFMLAGAVVGGSSTGVGQLVGSRVLLGVGTAFGQVTVRGSSSCRTISLIHRQASAYVPELAHPRLRHLAGSFLNCTYFIGSILSSWLTFAMVFYPDATSNDAWRIPTYIQGLGPVILAAGVWFVPGTSFVSRLATSLSCPQNHLVGSSRKAAWKRLIKYWHDYMLMD